MKKTLIALSLFAAFAASAQETSSQAAAQAGAGAASQAGAVGNSVTYAPVYNTEAQPAQSRLEQAYSGVLENRQSGGTFNQTDISGKQTIKNVPSIAMSGPASGPCTGVSGGLGVAGPGWGFGLNGANVEPTCVVRENVRVIGMAMQSLDGAANPQEKGEVMVLFMDSVRGLAAMNAKLLNTEASKK